MSEFREVRILKKKFEFRVKILRQLEFLLKIRGPTFFLKLRLEKLGNKNSPNFNTKAGISKIKSNFLEKISRLILKFQN